MGDTAAGVQSQGMQLQQQSQSQQQGPPSAQRRPVRRRFLTCSIPLLSWCPEDLVYAMHRFLGGRDLAAASCVCREFYFSAFGASWSHFFTHFGKVPPADPTTASGPAGCPRW